MPSHCSGHSGNSQFIIVTLVTSSLSLIYFLILLLCSCSCSLGSSGPVLPWFSIGLFLDSTHCFQFYSFIKLKLSHDHPHLLYVFRSHITSIHETRKRIIFFVFILGLGHMAFVFLFFYISVLRYFTVFYFP